MQMLLLMMIVATGEQPSKQPQQLDKTDRRGRYFAVSRANCTRDCAEDDRRIDIVAIKIYSNYDVHSIKAADAGLANERMDN